MRATQSQASLAYFASPYGGKTGLLIGYTPKMTAADESDDDDDGQSAENEDLNNIILDSRAQRDPVETLARCYADFDILKNDQRERLFEALGAQDIGRKTVLQEKSHHFNPGFDFPDDDFHAMRSQAEETRHQGILRKHQNYSWLHQLVRHIGHLRDTPDHDEILALQGITDLIDSPAGLTVGDRGFEMIIRSLEPRLLQAKNVRTDVLEHIRKMFGLSQEAAIQACTRAGYPGLLTDGITIMKALSRRGDGQIAAAVRNYSFTAPLAPTKPMGGPKRITSRRTATRTFFKGIHLQK
jgi:hypothetical protein